MALESNKDYMLRMIQLLFDSLLRINTAIDKQDEEGGRKEMSYAYSLLKKSREYFLISSSADIIEYLVSMDSSTKTIEYTGKLLFFEAEVEKENTIKEELLFKSKSLLEYYNNNSKTFSIESYSLINRINIQLDDLTSSS